MRSLCYLMAGFVACVLACSNSDPEAERDNIPASGEAKETPAPRVQRDPSLPAAPERLVVHRVDELRSYSSFAAVRDLDLALSLVDARTSPLAPDAVIPTADQCENVDLTQLALTFENLDSLRISGCQAAVVSGLQAFAGIRSLELADLVFDELTIARVAELRGLQKLTLLRVAATEAATVPIVRKLALQELNLRELDTDSLLGDLLGDLPTLRRVRLEGSWAGHRAMLSLNKANSLQRLELIDTSIGNFSLNQVKALTALEEVRWVGETFTDNSPLYLRDLPVQSFYCDCPRLGDGGIRHLRYLPQLKDLQLERSLASSAGLAALDKVETLERAVLGDLELDDRAFAGLAKLNKLVELDLAGGRLLEPGIATLAELKQLRHLNLRVEGLTSESTEAVAKLKNLRSLNLADTAIADDALVHLGELVKLESLELRGTRVTNEGLKHLARLTKLRRLTLDHTDVVDAGVEHLVVLTALEELRLDHTLVTDSCIDSLMKLPRLRELNLEHTVISKQGAQRLRAWGQLSRLGLAGSRAAQAQ